MTETEIKLEQNRKDQQVLKTEEVQLLKQVIKEKTKELKWKFGDVVLYGRDKRYLLFDETGKLRWFTEDEDNPFVATCDMYEYAFLAKSNKYVYVGNIFKE